MNAVPPSFTPAGVAGTDPAASAATALRWEVLADAAGLVATLAGIEAEAPSREMPDIAAAMRRAETWRRARAEHGVTDLAAMMEPGIAALLAVSARGADARPAAQALWREFVAARGAILALLSPAAGQVPTSA